jgi:hypothetical protein
MITLQQMAADNCIMSFRICTQMSVIKSRSMIRPRHVGCIRETKNAYEILVSKPQLRRSLGGDLGIDRRIILKWACGCEGVD